MYTLKELRKLCGLSQEETGDYINKTRQTYDNMEKGKTPLYNLQLEKLACLFGVDVSEIDTRSLKVINITKPYKLSDLRKAGVVKAFDIVFLCDCDTTTESFSQKLYNLENGRALIYTNELKQILRNTGVSVSDIDISTLWLVEYLGNGKIGKTLNKPSCNE